MNRAEWPESRTLGACRAVLRAASRRLPVLRRAEWLAEWEGELWALHRDGASGLALVRFAVAGVLEAGWERRGQEGTMGGMAQDVRQAVRSLGRTPAFTFVVVAVLALGIGTNTALYSAVRAALISPAPYPGSDRLVLVDLLLQRRAGADADTMNWSYPKFEMMRSELSRVSPIAGYVVQNGTLTGDGRAARIGVEYVTPGYFGLLSVGPALGRSFSPSEEYPNVAPVALLGHALWQSRFGGDAGIIGRTVTLDGATLEVVGVMPAGFRGVTGGADVWVPVSGITAIRGPRRLQQAWAHWLLAIGRLPDGVTLAEASQEAKRVGSSISAAYPDPSGGGEHDVAIVPFLRARVNPVARLAVSAVGVGALLLLLIACANVGGLMLARGSARRGDLAVRSALGAGRGRLARESMLESLILAAAGGAAGLVLASATQRLVASAVRHALDTSGSHNLQFLNPDSLGIDTNVLSVGLLFALVTGVLFGVLPALRASRPDLRDQLGSAARSVGRRSDGQGARGLLVAGQLALTLTLLAGAGTMAASLDILSGIDPGYDNGNVLAVRFDRGPSPAGASDVLFEQDLLGRVGALPGVLSVATAPCPPLAGLCEVVGVRQVDDGPVADYGAMEAILAFAVSDTYWQTLGIGIVEGRAFDASNRAGSAPVVMINRAAASALYGNVSPIGHRLAITHELTENTQAEIIGVVEDVRQAGLEEPANPAAYLSRRQAPIGYGTLLVRTSGDPYAHLDGLRDAVALVAPDVPLYGVTTVAEIRAGEVARTRVLLGLLGAFALTGLLLSAIGLYGVVSWTVARRTREMGLRVVLGAVASDVAGLVMRPPVLLTAAGAVAGIAGAVALTRSVESLLFGIRAADPRVLAAATATLFVVAVVAAWIPARRATRVDPARALRSD